MPNPIETGKYYLVRIGEVTQAPRDYLGSVLNRTIGRSAWQEAIRKYSKWDNWDEQNRPRWAKGMYLALTSAAPLSFALEAGWSATSRLFLPAVYDERAPIRFDLFKVYGIIPTFAIDMSLIYASLSLAHNPLEAVGLKLAVNAATHISLDITSVVGKGATRLYRHFKPPTATTLAV